jgi:hypothetical protein
MDHQRNRVASLVSGLLHGASIRTLFFRSDARSGVIRIGRLGPQGAVGQYLVALRTLAIPPHANLGAFASLLGILVDCKSSFAFQLKRACS